MGSQSNRYSLSRFAVEEESIVPHDETVAPDVDLGQYTQMVPLYANRSVTAGTTSASSLGGSTTTYQWSLLWHVLYFALLVTTTTLLSVVIQSSAHPPSVRHFIKPYCNNVIVAPPEDGLFSTIGNSKQSIPFNYALKQCGARVLPDLTFVDKRSTASTTFLPALARTPVHNAEEGIPHISVNAPDTALDGEVAPENCWEFMGAHGQLGLGLVNELNVTYVSIDYSIEGGSNSAPRSMVLWGLVDGRKAMDIYDSAQDIVSLLHTRLPLTVPGPSPQDQVYVPLAAFEYNPHLLTHQQYFPVFKETSQLGFPIGIVVVQVLGNWGGNSTKLCGVSIHGIAVHDYWD